ncbi:hypothetical protein MTO96_018856 [Rhipicephalus appendiculatus]
MVRRGHCWWRRPEGGPMQRCCTARHHPRARTRERPVRNAVSTQMTVARRDRPLPGNDGAVVVPSETVIWPDPPQRSRPYAGPRVLRGCCGATTQ